MCVTCDCLLLALADPSLAGAAAPTAADDAAQLAAGHLTAADAAAFAAAAPPEVAVPPFGSARPGAQCPAVDMVVEKWGPVHGTEAADEAADLMLQRSER